MSVFLLMEIFLDYIQAFAQNLQYAYFASPLRKAALMFPILELSGDNLMTICIFKINTFEVCTNRCDWNI